jgi:hypothetical protein
MFEDTKGVTRRRKSTEKIIQWPQEMFEDNKGVIRSRKSKEKIIQFTSSDYPFVFLQTFLVAIVLFSPLIYGFWLPLWYLQTFLVAIVLFSPLIYGF